MPFKGTCPVEERIALFREYDTGIFTVAELCARFGVSRQTFYDWHGRRASGVERWWEDRTHATASCPHRTPDGIAAALIAMRQRFPHFGPKKIRARLVYERPDVAWPAVKRAALDIRANLKKLGLTSFLKTTGGKGLHVVLPFARGHFHHSLNARPRGLRFCGHNGDLLAGERIQQRALARIRPADDGNKSRSH